MKKIYQGWCISVASDQPHEFAVVIGIRNKAKYYVVFVHTAVHIYADNGNEKPDYNCRIEKTI